MKRRSFGKLGIGTCAGLAIGTGQPGGLLQALAGELALKAERSAMSECILVVSQLLGGNDGLKTCPS